MDFYFFIFLKTIVYDNFEEKSVKFFEKFFLYEMQNLIKKNYQANFEEF